MFDSIGSGFLTEQIQLGWYFNSTKKYHSIRITVKIVISYNPDDDTNLVDAVKLRVVMNDTDLETVRSVINKMILHKNSFLLLRGKGRVEVSDPKKIQYVSKSLKSRSDYTFTITVVGSPVRIISRLKAKITDLFKKLKSYVPQKVKSK
jgi:hypothetical protein